MPAAADASGQGGDFVAFATPTRALDTRSGIGGVTGKLAAAGSATFSVLGVGAVPTGGVSAVLVKLVAIGPSANTYLEAWPDGTTRPSRTMLAAGDGETISNTAVVQPGANGKLGIYNSTGTTHAVVDVLGYYRSASDGTGGGFVPVAQKRFVDTRSGIGTSAGTIAAGAARTVTFTGGVVPAGASAVFVNLMVVGASASGSVTAVPAGTTPGYPALNHVAGTTSSGVSVKLSADGRATFTNGGDAAIDLVVDVEGYFTATSTTGAGLRKVANRLLDTRSTTAVAAGGTVDVVVAGTSGLPTRGVAGAVLNLIVPNPAQSGNISAWSVGDTATGYSMMHFEDGTTRAGLTVLKPGTDGRVRIKNNSSGVIDVVVDLQGWYADPILAVPVTTFTPTAVLQGAPASGATLGTVEYAYTDNIGRVVVGHQTDVDNFGYLQWTVVSGNDAFSGTPALNTLSDGRTQLTAQNIDSDVWATSQTETSAATWNTWSDLGGSMAAPPAAIRLSTGVTVLFAVDIDGNLWAYAQTGTVPYWKNLGDRNLVGTPSVAATRDGVQIFARDTTGAVQTAEYVDGALSAWTDLGGAGATSAPSVVVYPGYRLRVFVRAADGTIATKAQDSTGAFATAWDTLGTYVSGGAPAAILDPIVGRIAVVTRDPSGTITITWESAQGSGVFGVWNAAIPNLTDPSATDPTVAPVTNSNGQRWVIAFRNANNASRVYVSGDLTPLTALTASAAGAFTAYTLPAPPA